MKEGKVDIGWNGRRAAYSITVAAQGDFDKKKIIHTHRVMAEQGKNKKRRGKNLITQRSKCALCGECREFMYVEK